MLHKIKKPLEYIKLFKRPPEHLSVLVLDSPAAVQKAQQLHAQVYLERGYIIPDAVGTDQRMTSQYDTYQHHSVYFAVIDTSHPQSQITATVRQINVKSPLGHNSFPTLRFLHISKEYLKKIHELNPDCIVEISGLAKLKGHSPYAPLLLYRRMWQYSLEADHALWIMACDVRVYQNLKALFGDALMRIGPETFYMGSNVVPAIMDVKKSLDFFTKKSRSINPIRRHLHYRFAKFFLEGVDIDMHKKGGKHH